MERGRGLLLGLLASGKPCSYRTRIRLQHCPSALVHSAARIPALLSNQDEEAEPARTRAARPAGGNGRDASTLRTIRHCPADAGSDAEPKLPARYVAG